MIARREFLRRSSALLALPLGAGTLAAQGQDTVRAMRDTVVADQLAEPWLVGQTRESITKLDNDPGIVALERRLRCTCGCTLDIYTCRTTDFTCTFSPALHREIQKMWLAGKTPQQIVDAFVAREGEKMLMAPEPKGFNLAGYLVPGIAVLTVGLALAAWLSRRRPEVAAASAGATPATPAPDAEAMERLRKALDEVDA